MVLLFSRYHPITIPLLSPYLVEYPLLSHHYPIIIPLVSHYYQIIIPLFGRVLIIIPPLSHHPVIIPLLSNYYPTIIPYLVEYPLLSNHYPTIIPLLSHYYPLIWLSVQLSVVDWPFLLRLCADGGPGCWRHRRLYAFCFALLLQAVCRHGDLILQSTFIFCHVACAPELPNIVLYAPWVHA